MADHGGHPERIIPSQTAGGPLASHLKRYIFAAQWCTDRTVLDAACGVGYGSALLGRAARRVTGVDVSVPAVAYAKAHYSRPNVDFSVMDVHQLGYPSASVDLVCSFETIEHVRDPKQFLDEVTRVLSREGALLISTPQARQTTAQPDNPFHTVEYCRKDFEDLLRMYFDELTILGQRRRQSRLHRSAQSVDKLRLRSLVPAVVRRAVVSAMGTRAWDVAGLDDILIDAAEIDTATELVGVCRQPVGRSTRVS